MSDLIDRQAAIDYVDCGNLRPPTELAWSDWDVVNMLKQLPSAEPEIIRCKDCIYYDPPHIEENGERREYKDMPPEAFDKLGTGLVNMSYGINVGGRCLKDYNVGYSDDKRIYVPETNYCGRAAKKEVEHERRNIPR